MPAIATIRHYDTNPSSAKTFPSSPSRTRTSFDRGDVREIIKIRKIRRSYDNRTAADTSVTTRSDTKGFSDQSRVPLELVAI